MKNNFCYYCKKGLGKTFFVNKRRRYCDAGHTPAWREADRARSKKEVK